jgi:hypothetical protein
MQRNRDIDETQETEDVPPQAACVKTLPEAVKLSLNAGLDDKCLFNFARALKALEITINRRLPAAELSAAFAQWWNAAKPSLPPDANFDEWRFDFEATFAKTHAALGANSLQEAIRRADAITAPKSCVWSLSATNSNCCKVRVRSSLVCATPRKSWE